MTTPALKQIEIRRQSRVLQLQYDNNETYALSFEFLRVHSPSAEVKGHGPGQEVLQFGKENVLISGIEPVGNYAIKIIFNDGHDSGIYSWVYLYELCNTQESLWTAYLESLQLAGKSRIPSGSSKPVVHTFDPGKKH